MSQVQEVVFFFFSVAQRTDLLVQEHRFTTKDEDDSNNGDFLERERERERQRTGT